MAKEKTDFTSPVVRDKVTNYFTADLSKLYADPRRPGFLVDQLIPSSGVLLLTGPPGIGKSWVVYDLMRAVATGTPWLGKSAPACSGSAQPVLLFDYDNGVINIRSRLVALGVPESAPIRIHAEGIVRSGMESTEELRIPIIDEKRGESDDSNTLDIIAAIIDHHDARLVVFDSMRRSHTGDENDSKSMGGLMTIFKKLSRRLGFESLIENRLVVLVHHTPKGGGGRSRGSGEIDGSSDLILEVKKHKKELVVVWDKVRAWRFPEGYGTKDTTGRPMLRFAIDEVKGTRDGDRVYVRAIDRMPGAEEAKYVTLARAIEAILEEGRRSKKGRGKKWFMGYLEIQKAAKKAGTDINRKGEFDLVVEKGIEMGWFHRVEKNEYVSKMGRVPTTSMKSLALGRAPM